MPPPTSPEAGKASGRRERKRLQTEDHLTDTAFHLFEAKGFDAVTMEEIAAAADVAKGTLYKHFPVKEALLAHWVHRSLAGDLPALRVAMAAQPDTAGRLRCLMQTSAEWTRRYRVYLRHYLRYRLVRSVDDDPAQRSGLDQVVLTLIEQGQACGDLRRDVSAIRLTHLFRFLHLGAMLRWLDAPDRDLQLESDAVLAVFLGGARADSSAARRK